MATHHLSIDDYLSAIKESSSGLSTCVTRVDGLEAPVPTCPEWSIRELVAHQGMVHRWAAANVRGDRDYDTKAAHAEGMAIPDERLLREWFVAGATDLTAAIEAAPDDAEAMVFLKNAPPPRLFWARRQAHETTIHSIDALAAALGRFPRTDEISVGSALAADGIDELIMGFLPRRVSRLRSDDPFVFVVRTTDSDDSWTVRVSDDRPETARGAAAQPDATLSGTAAGLYVGLWNRGDDFTVDGRTDALTAWRTLYKIHWSG